MGRTKGAINKSKVTQISLNELNAVLRPDIMIPVDTQFAETIKNLLLLNSGMSIQKDEDEDEEIEVTITPKNNGREKEKEEDKIEFKTYIFEEDPERVEDEDEDVDNTTMAHIAYGAH